MKKYALVLLSFLMIISQKNIAQENNKIVKELTLDEVIEISISQSPDCYLAKHQFLINHWKFKIYKAGRLPGLWLNSTLPNYNRTVTPIVHPDGKDFFVERKSLNWDMNLTMQQALPLTGGDFFISSGINRFDFENDSSVYSANIINIGFTQPLSGFNRYRWEKLIEPLKYKEAKSSYIEKIENIKQKSVDYFFSLMQAQINYEMAKVNNSNNDTLLKIGKGRYNIGTIAQNELLEIELNYLNSQQELNETELQLEVRKNEFRSFLGFNENIDFKLKINKDIPQVEIDVKKVVELAMQNNSQIQKYNYSLIESQRNVAETKSKRFDAKISASVGFNTLSAEDIPQAYQDPLDKQTLKVSLNIPLIQWGKAKGDYKLAKSNQELTEIEVRLGKQKFEQDVYVKAKQFNMQDNQLYIAAKADTIAKNRYEITLQRFYIGKINVIELNNALKAKDSARRNYIESLRKFWNYYYDIRRLTLYDFINNKPLEQDFDTLL